MIFNAKSTGCREFRNYGCCASDALHVVNGEIACKCDQFAPQELHMYAALDPTSAVIGRNLKALRGHMSTTELARRSGVARITIEKIEGFISNPYYATVHRLAAALGVSVNRLAHDFGGEVANEH